MKNKSLRYVLVVAAAAAMAVPFIGRSLHGQDAATAPAAAPSTQPVDPNKAVIQIGDQKITAGEFEAFVDDLPPQYQEMARGPAKRMLAQELVKMKLLAMEARERKLDQTPKVQKQLAMVTEQVLAGAVASDVVSDADAQKYYDEHKDQYLELKARHILVRGAKSPMPLAAGAKELTDEQAKAKADEIKKRLDKGEDFAAVAKAESDDKGSGAEGGELGTFSPGQMVPEFSKAALALKPNQISEPVKSEFGYHVIQLQEKIEQPFDQVKAQIKSKMSKEAVDKLIAELEKKHKTQLDESFFGPAMPAGPMMP